MPDNAVALSKKSLSSYAELRRRVREAIAAGKERALEAVERESVRTKWEVGKLIQEHVLLHQSRADYGRHVLLRLSKEIGVSDRELRYMVEFARTYPIWPVPAKLSWAHYRDLLAVNDPAERKQIAEKAGRGKWTQEVLRREIGKLKSARQITVSEAAAEEPLVPLKGKLDTWRIITAKAGPWAGEPAIDLGFANYHLPAGSLQRFKDRDIVESRLPSLGDGHLSVIARRPAGPTKQSPSTEIASSQKTLLAMTGLNVAKDAAEKDLFTYRAWLLQVTDGDTLWALIDLGFGFVTQQQLRLRGIDAPEITSRDGQEAKRFVERELKGVSPFIVASTKSDKYDRYLADVFYTVNGRERFLQNRLLKAGFAERV